MYSKTVFFIVALFSYVIPFIFPSLFFLIFIFPSFLFFAFQGNPSLLAIITWSYTAAMLHLVPICDALINMAYGPWYARLIPALLLIMYVASYIALWLFLTHKTIQFNHIRLLQLIVWTGSLWIYCMITDYLLLWPFGRCEGYIFMNPLLPLIASPQLLSLLSILPYSVVLALFCCFTTAITATFYHFKIATFLLIMAILAWCNRFPPVSSVPDWLFSIGHLPLIVPASTDAYAGSLLIRHELDQISMVYPQITTVIMPESAWNGIKISHLSCLPWAGHSINQLIIGSFSQNKSNWTNRLYYFKNNLLHYYFDKRHAVPITERAIRFLSFNEALFFEKTPPIAESTNERLPFYITDTDSCIPYLCSELFCNNWPDDSFNQTPILALINDWWFRMPHFQQLMAYAARLQAIKWRRSILYISFHYAYFFSCTGQATPIPTNTRHIS